MNLKSKPYRRGDNRMTESTDSTKQTTTPKKVKRERERERERETKSGELREMSRDREKRKSLIPDRRPISCFWDF